MGRSYHDVAVVEVLAGLHNHTADYCSEEFDRNLVKRHMRMERKFECEWNRNRSSRRGLGSLKTAAHSPWVEYHSCSLIKGWEIGMDVAASHGSPGRNRSQAADWMEKLENSMVDRRRYRCLCSRKC